MTPDPLPPLRCEQGDHDVRGAIYRPRAGDPFACADCLRKAGIRAKWIGGGNG